VAIWADPRRIRAGGLGQGMFDQIAFILTQIGTMFPGENLAVYRQCLQQVIASAHGTTWEHLRQPFGPGLDTGLGRAGGRSTFSRSLMRLLYLVHQFPPQFATGTEILTLETARAARRWDMRWNLDRRIG